MRYLIYFLTIAGLFLWLKSDAGATARGFVGPGTFVIVTPSGETIGRVDGKRVDSKPAEQDGKPGFGTPDNPATFRLQIENITPNRHAEPDCPRGVKVLRYGVRGC